MINCKKCGRKIDKFEAFSNGVCVSCYEEQWNAKSEKEKMNEFNGLADAFKNTIKLTTKS